MTTGTTGGLLIVWGRHIQPQRSLVRRHEEVELVSTTLNLYLPQQSPAPPERRAAQGARTEHRRQRMHDSDARKSHRR